jgi:regulator of sirC expression with transglutaminase-like and TPR domain
MTAGCWLGDAKRKSVLRDGTIHAVCIARRLSGVLPLYERPIPHQTHLRIASPRRKTFYHPFGGSSVRKDSCVRWDYQTKKVTSGITREFKRRIDTLHIHSRPMDQTNNFKRLAFLRDCIVSMSF